MLKKYKLLLMSLWEINFKTMADKKKKFKPHMMYCKNGSAKKAMTYKEHLALKKKGCGHKKPKNK